MVYVIHLHDFHAVIVSLSQLVRREVGDLYCYVSGDFDDTQSNKVLIGATANSTVRAGQHNWLVNIAITRLLCRKQSMRRGSPKRGNSELINIIISRNTGSAVRPAMATPNISVASNFIARGPMCNFYKCVPLFSRKLDDIQINEATTGSTSNLCCSAAITRSSRSLVNAFCRRIFR
jgi:hypothetical protein